MGKHAPAGYVSDMPAFGGQLSEDEIIAVLAYIKSRWPDHVHRKRRAAGMT
jgi:mono/diheme cytochrome c family protein